MSITSIKEAKRNLERVKMNEGAAAVLKETIRRKQEEMDRLEAERERLEREVTEWKNSPPGRETAQVALVSRMIEKRIPACGREEIRGFFRDMRRRGLSVSALRNNISGMRGFLEWYNSATEWNGWENVTPEVVYEYAGHELNSGFAKATVRTRTANLRAFFTYLEDEGRIKRSPWRKRAMVKLDKPLPRAMTLEDLDAWLDALEEASVFDRAALLLLLRSGMRVGEMMRVRVEDVNMEEMSIKLYVGEKNRLGRIVYFTKDALGAIEEWMKERMRMGVDSVYLFAKRKGVLSYSGFRFISAKQLERAGLQGKYNLHSLRHTYATLLVNAGMEIQYLQRLMGHDSIQTTLRYAVLDEREAHEEYHRVIEKIERRTRKHD
jgi:integrase/recombinase XerD